MCKNTHNATQLRLPKQVKTNASSNIFSAHVTRPGINSPLNRKSVLKNDIKLHLEGMYSSFGSRREELGWMRTFAFRFISSRSPVVASITLNTIVLGLSVRINSFLVAPAATGIASCGELSLLRTITSTP